MAHPEQQGFFDKVSLLFPDHFGPKLNVLEVGSQDINGSVRSLFDQSVNYLGLDIGMARGVDWTVPGELIELPDAWADTSISTECFEHAHSWPQILINMIRITKPGGLLILTMAGDERPAHGTVDSEEGSSPFTAMYYKNLGVEDLAERIKLGHYFNSHGFEVNSLSKDTYFWGLRSGNSISEQDDYWAPPLERLARAQGQLVQAVYRHNAIRQETEHLRQETDHLRQDVHALRSELAQIKASRWYRLRELLG